MVLQNATRRCLIAEESDACQPRDQLLEEFELLPRLLRIEGGDAGEVSTRTVQIGHQVAHWIDNHRCNYRYRRRRAVRSTTGHSSDSDQDIHLLTDKFGRENGELIVSPRRPPRLDGEVPTIDIPQVGKPLTECPQRSIGGRLRRSNVG
jgi:hypothetical protein